MLVARIVKNSAILTIEPIERNETGLDLEAMLLVLLKSRTEGTG